MEKLLELFKLLMRLFSLHIDDGAAVNRLGQTTVVEDISKVLTECEIGPFYFKELLSIIYNNRFRQILKLINKLEGF